MIDLAKYQGIAEFGPAYRIMLERDAHAAGSVDRLLQARMIRLCRETAEHLYTHYTPLEVEYTKGSRPLLEDRAIEIVNGAGSEAARIEGVATFCNALGERAPAELDVMRLGGTEEEIIRRGSDWCTDVARVACVLYQVLGFPARLANLFDLAQAYSGHVITEVYRQGTWGAVDPTTSVVYHCGNGSPASTWDLMNQQGLIEAHYRGPGTPYTTPGQFTGAAIVNYFVWEHHRYDFTVAGPNEYCRSILEMAARGWPAGLRWLHGEGEEVNRRPTFTT
jgi:hypothetical protein